MAYVDATTLHALPVENSRSPLYPTTTLFPRGPDWTRRFQKNQPFDHLDDQFMYKDQGPPLYRLQGQHFNMYKIPPRTDVHSDCRSYHYEPRPHNVPYPARGTLAFPSYPPPAQVAMFDGITQKRQPAAKTAQVEMPGTAVKSLKAYDKYRPLTGPPSETQMYGGPQAWQLPKV